MAVVVNIQQQHCRNADAIAEYLQQQPLVDKLYYPGLATHHNHDIVKKQCSGFGGIVSFSLKTDTEEAAAKFVTSTKYFKLAESLGGVKSLLCLPSAMTHKSIPAEKRRAAGVCDSLIRLSVGLEDVKDLIDDLDQAFEKLNREKKIPSTVENIAFA